MHFSKRSSLTETLEQHTAFMTINKTDAQQLLSMAPLGTYIVRYPDKIDHPLRVLIERTLTTGIPDTITLSFTKEGISLKAGETYTYPSLDAFIQGYNDTFQPELRLRQSYADWLKTTIRLSELTDTTEKVFSNAFPTDTFCTAGEFVVTPSEETPQTGTYFDIVIYWPSQDQDGAGLDHNLHRFSITKCHGTHYELMQDEIKGSLIELIKHVLHHSLRIPLDYPITPKGDRSIQDGTTVHDSVHEYW